jgi:hypothetical protein
MVIKGLLRIDRKEVKKLIVLLDSIRQENILKMLNLLCQEKKDWNEFNKEIMKM